MTANLLHDRGDPEDLARVLSETEPDVVVTQELSPDCAQVLADTFQHHHLRPAHDFKGRGIASRLPAQFGDIAMPVREATWAILGFDGGLIRLVGMHLVNPIEFPPWRSVRRRTEQLDALFDWTDSGDDDVPLLVAGDMNASPGWPAYRKMARRWRDLVVEASDSELRNPEPTWAWRPGWPRVLRIDHVLGMGVSATWFDVVPIAGSDHHAVVVDVQI